jgi:phosphoglycolate/pyridoxal phosphate phosphatase family enzyme
MRNDINSPLSLNNIEGVIFDLDGTVYLGENALPGAVETIQILRQVGIQVLFVSNKPLSPRDHYAAKLSRMGIPTKPDDVITSGYVLGYHLANNYPDLKLYVVGEKNLKDELLGHGLTILDEFFEQDEKQVIVPRGIDAVVVAFDRTLDYRKLNTAYQALVQGAKFFATNADKACPMPGGGIPDAGGTIAALEHMTGRSLDLLAGKPSKLMIEVSLARIGKPAERCLMVGDRLETDIRMGKEAGMYAALVLTGASTRAQAEIADPKPDIVLTSIAELCY